MPVFEPKVPWETREPVILVEGKLPPGKHTFQLVVEDDDGLRSAPSKRVVLVGEQGPALPQPPPDEM